MAKLETVVETWPLAGRFTISRGSKTEARVVVAMIQDGEHRLSRPQDIARILAAVAEIG